jgi:energy-coupling factor transport system ATP-binding protein
LEIKVEKLGHVYNRGTPLEVTALKEVDFALPSGKILGILGATGSGKTTLARTLNGLIAPTSGRVLLDGIDAQSFGPGLTRKVGVVFQRPELQLFEDTVYKDISYVMRLFSKATDDEIREKVAGVCDRVNLDLESVGHRPVQSLSDGQKRKVAISGILTNDPEVLILDEPSVGLDPPSVAEMVQLVKNLSTMDGCSVLIVSHNMEPFLSVLDLLLVLDNGRQEAFGQIDGVCEALWNSKRLWQTLPPLVRLVHDLRLAGAAIPLGEYRIPALADIILEFVGRHAKIDAH